jgi:hypothetical protein
MKTVILRVGKRVAGPPAGYPVSIHCDDAGAGWDVQPLASEVIPEQLDGLVPPVPGAAGGPARNVVLAGATPNAGAGASLQQLGEDLFRLICRGAVSVKWDELRDRYKREVPARGEEGRRVLVDIRDPDLRRYPWELMRRPGTPIWLACDPGNTLARISPWPGTPPGPLDPDDPPAFQPDATARAADGPLRILVVIGSEPGDQRVQADRERHGVERALWGLSVPWSSQVLSRADADACRCKFDLRVLEQPVSAEIAEACRDHRPHVFHFIGHGTIGAGGTTSLRLWSPKNNPNREIDYTIDDLYRDIDSPNLDMAVLNCCYATPEAWQGSVWSIAKVFLDKRARAVLGTLGPVPGETAARLAGALYRELAAGWPIDQALAEARAKVERSGATSFDRALPYLHLATYPEVVLSLPRRDRVDPVASEREFQSNASFVDRYTDRTWLRTAAVAAPASAAPGAATPRRLVLLQGGSRIGKSQLLQFMMEKFALSGRTLKYVPLAGRGAIDFLGLIRAIKGGAPGSILKGPLQNPPDAFNALNRALNAMAANVHPRKREADTFPTEDGGGKPKERPPEDAIEFISDKFLDGLKAVAAAGGGLIVVLDQLTDREGNGLIPLEFQSLAKPWLIERIAAGHAPGVTLVIAVNNGPELNEYDALGFSRLNAQPEWKLLKEIPGAEFRCCAEEYCRRRDYATNASESVIKTFEQVFGKIGWSPSLFEMIDSAVKGLAAGGGPPP